MAAFPKGLRTGTILRHSQFYLDEGSGELKPKYLLVLACTRGGDVVWRLLTSRQHGRPEQPPCYHGDPYPGFYLGVIDPSAGLGSKSWLDLRGLDDGDGPALASELEVDVITVATQLHSEPLCSALECAAAADDTTQGQERAIRDRLASL